MYDWTRPKIAVPAHGEPLHLSEHYAFAKARGVKEVVRAYDGDVVALQEGRAGASRSHHGGPTLPGMATSLLPGRRGMCGRTAPPRRLRHRFRRARPIAEGATSSAIPT